MVPDLCTLKPLIQYAYTRDAGYALSDVIIAGVMNVANVVNSLVSVSVRTALPIRIQLQGSELLLRLLGDPGFDNGALLGGDRVCGTWQR